MNTESNGGNNLAGIQEYSRISMLFLNDPLKYARQYADTLVQFADSNSWDNGLKSMSFGMAYETLKELNDPDNEDYWYAKGVICERLYHLHHDAGNYEDAIDYCEDLLKVEEHRELASSCSRIDEKTRIHVNMSKCYQAISDNEHAVRHFREALSLIKSDEMGWVWAMYELLDSEYVWSMCLADFNQDKWEAVRDLCLDVLAILEDIDNSIRLEVYDKIDEIQLREKIHILLSIACKKSGDNDSALSYQKKAEELNTDAAILLNEWSCEFDEVYEIPLADWEEDLSQEEIESLKSQGDDMSDYHHYQDALSNWSNQEDSIFKFAQENGLNLFSEKED